MILLLLVFLVAELNGLDASGPYPAYAEKLELFGQLVGDYPVGGHLTNTQKSANLTHRGTDMRTNIDIDENLIRRAMQASGERTKRAAVDRALRLLVRTHAQAGIRRLRGKIRWRGDVNESRLSRALR